MALYVFGFRTGWQFIFPAHPDLAVDAGIFVVLVTIALVSAGFAFGVQFVIPALFISALGAVAATVFTLPLDEPVRLIGDFPGAPSLAMTTVNGEPREAVLVTAVVAVGALLLRDLNAVAALITMLSLITDAMVDGVVLLEQGLGLVGFRPLLRIPRAVALVGAVGCIFATFVAVAEWAVEKASRVGGSRERAWKPNLLVPVEDADELRGTFRLILDIAAPKGSLTITGWRPPRRLLRTQHGLAADPGRRDAHRRSENGGGEGA